MDEARHEVLHIVRLDFFLQSLALKRATAVVKYGNKAQGINIYNLFFLKPEHMTLVFTEECLHSESNH